MISRVRRAVKWRWTRYRNSLLWFGIRKNLLRWRIEHVHGPRQPNYGPDELLVMCTVYNGAQYVKSFVEHYASLGVKHLVFCDNGSSDDTVERLCRHDNVTVLRTRVPYRTYENAIKRYMAERFSWGRWNLCADIDERLVLPLGDRATLADFLRYLNHYRYNAVLVQMLDMFSEVPLSELTSDPEENLKEKYPYYDISALKRRPYEWSKPPDPRIAWHYGGIRKAAFNTGNCLTKAALVRIDGTVKTFVNHHQVTHARIADVSCLFLHYPFVRSFYEKVREAAASGRYGNVTSPEYRAYWKVLQDNPRLSLKRPTAKRFHTADELIEDDFIVVSDQYRRWVETHKNGV